MWPILLRVLEKQGIATLFAVVLLLAMWRVTEEHLHFLQQQRDLMSLQTNTLSTIAESNKRQEQLLVIMNERVDSGIDNSVKTHAEILKQLNHDK